MTNEIVKGSVLDIANQSNKSLAEVMSQVDYFILCDVSGSMMDLVGNQTKYQWLLDALAELQKILPGKCAVWGFSDTLKLHKNGLPEFQRGSTRLYYALDNLLEWNGLIDKLFIISDGYPDSPFMALEVAKNFTDTTIEGIYIGADDERGYHFMQQLTNGRCFNNETLTDVTEKTVLLLTEVV